MSQERERGASSPACAPSMMTVEEAAAGLPLDARQVLAESARRIAAVFAAQLPETLGPGAAVATYAAAKAWAEALAATFGPHVQELADRLALDLREAVLEDAGLSPDATLGTRARLPDDRGRAETP
ncbi:MAG TPA: hypothetical protein VF841_14135 [Anaeromyxobacter sp.]